MKRTVVLVQLSLALSFVIEPNSAMAQPVDKVEVDGGILANRVLVVVGGGLAMADLYSFYASLGLFGTDPAEHLLEEWHYVAGGLWATLGVVAIFSGGEGAATLGAGLLGYAGAHLLFGVLHSLLDEPDRGAPRVEVGITPSQLLLRTQF